MCFVRNKHINFENGVYGSKLKRRFQFYINGID